MRESHWGESGIVGQRIQSLQHVVRRSATIAGLAFVTALSGCATNDTVDGSTKPDASPSITAAPTPSPEPATPTPSETPSPTPVITTEIVTETETIPFKKVLRDDASMDLGKEAIATKGVDGVKTLTYEVVLSDGVETSRQLVSEEITTKPVDEVTSVGTRKPPPPPPDPEPECDPNYAGACVPIDSDVDCAGGGGNGPSYVQGPVRVVGSDIYDLDRDGDGIGCER